jgi:hypothetical protein
LLFKGNKPMPEKVKIEKSGDIIVLDSLPVYPAASAVLQRLRFHPEINFNAVTLRI